MEYGGLQVPCPRCGSAAGVRTVRELFDMLNAMQGEAAQRAEALRRQGPVPFTPGPSRRGPERTYGRDDPGQEIADAVIGSAGRLIGRAIGRRLQRAYEDRIMPALDARAEQARAEQEQARGEQAMIAERYPDLYGCLPDQVIFLAGHTGTVPFSDLPMPVTLAQADSIVSRLRGQ